MKKTISAYKSEKFFMNCKRGFVAIGTKQNEDWNRKLYAKHASGDWEISDEKVKEGDAFFLILPHPEGTRGYRELHVGKVDRVEKAPDLPGRFRIYVKKSFSTLAPITDGVWNFLGVKGTSPKALLQVWGKELNKLRTRKESANAKSSLPIDASAAEGAMVQRLTWLRDNHSAFREPVRAHWKNKCAVTSAGCDGLLVASHIKPWRLSSPKQKTDLNNGLLLSTALDALFDRGLISFSNDGTMLLSSLLSIETAKIFGVNKKLKLDLRLVTAQMKTYLAWHRKHFKF